MWPMIGLYGKLLNSKYTQNYDIKMEYDTLSDCRLIGIWKKLFAIFVPWNFTEDLQLTQWKRSLATRKDPWRPESKHNQESLQTKIFWENFLEAFRGGECHPTCFCPRFTKNNQKVHRKLHAPQTSTYPPFPPTFSKANLRFTEKCWDWRTNDINVKAVWRWCF